MNSGCRPVRLAKPASSRAAMLASAAAPKLRGSRRPCTPRLARPNHRRINTSANPISNPRRTRRMRAEFLQMLWDQHMQKRGGRLSIWLTQQFQNGTGPKWHRTSSQANSRRALDCCAWALHSQFGAKRLASPCLSAYPLFSVRYKLLFAQLLFTHRVANCPGVWAQSVPQRENRIDS